MVNDPKNASLIRWSDDGDSFFVLDHERFANEVLGRWFKHKNFSSFVRQLNMYGFHKIPHLQQGVLRSDSETEFWNFAHANFHRGQPDLLCLIQRKKQSSQQQMQFQQQADDVVAAAAAAAAGLVADANGNPVGVGTAFNGAPVPGVTNVPAGPVGAPGSGSTGLTVLSNAQILDIHSIVQGIAAIKRHQATISVELSELKRSNELLWQDALMAREKHQKQEDTINRIVKFLAGVFGKQAAPGSSGVGNGGGGHHGEDDGNSSPNVSMQRRGGGGGDHHHHHRHQNDIHRGGDGMGVVTRRRARLMIEDGRKQARPVPSTGATIPVSVVEMSEESDEDVTMTDSTVAMNQASGAVPGMTLSDYRSPPSPTTSQGILELGDDTATTSSFSALDLNDAPSGAAHADHDSVDYPRVESDIETPKSVNTPLPTSPADAKKEAAATNPHLRAALISERAVTRTPPVFHGPHSQQGNSAHGHSASAGSADNTTFSFDPRNLMINLTSAQIQQLLTTLASQAPSGSMDHYEGGFLTSADVDDNTRREDASSGLTHHAVQQNRTPPFDISSYLVPSPQLANLSLAAGSNATPNPDAAPSSTSTTSPALGSASTPRAGGDGGAYVPVPDGLIAFEGSSDANGKSKTAAAGTGAVDTADAASAAYAGDLSVMRSQSPFMLPWTYQGYNGFSAPNANPAGPITATGGGYANGSAVPGFAGFSFPSFGTGPEWSGSGSGGAGGTEEVGGEDYNGLFAPVLQNAALRAPYSATPGGASANATTTTTTTTPDTTNAGQMQNQSLSANNAPNSGAVGAYNPSSPRSVRSLEAELATLSSNWHATEDIDRDVNALNTTIHNLIQTFGLDPSLMDTEVQDGRGANAGAGVNPGATGGTTTDGTADKNGNGAEATRGRKNSVFDFEHFFDTWGLPGAGGASGGAAPGGVGVSVDGLSGIATVPPSDAATTASSSTPSGGSVADEGPDGLDADGGADGLEIEENGVGVGGVASSLGFAPAKTVPARVPLQAQTQVQTRPTSSSGSAAAAAAATLMDDGGARPINKKARTSLTASAPTSAGVPITTVETGGRKRRSAIVGVGAAGGEGECVDVVADVGQESGGVVATVAGSQTRSAAKGSGATKTKKRRG